MIARTMKHRAIKDEKKKITHYEIIADGEIVGTAKKGPGGPGGSSFSFFPNWEGGKNIGHGTMRDLKKEVEKIIPEGYVENLKASREADFPKRELNPGCVEPTAEIEPTPEIDEEDIDLI